ncbi:MAG: hypothetical protein H6R00_2616 [Proteobacteria bacterium]|nr:hypothetical protein [Pseudomonadota bacterium]
MRYDSVFGALAVLGGCLIGSAALAADWQIATVSGKAYRLDGATWVPVAAHDRLALGEAVKTLGAATLTLARAGVTITVGPSSQLQIKERLDGKFTDVLQTAGSAAVEVDPAKHIRLAVETPYMAAVVKGTVFSVSTFEGYSETAVTRGRVAVIDVTNSLEVDVTAGQKATSGEDKPLSVDGTGSLATPEPLEGKVVTRADDGTLVETETDDDGKGKSASGKSEDGADKAKSDDKGKSDDSSDKSDDSSDKSGDSDHGDSGSDHGNSGGDHGNSGSDHGNSGHGSED